MMCHMLFARRALFALLLLAAAAAPAPARADEPLRVVASFSVLADLVREIGGDHVTVASLVPPGAEPHDWEPKPRDIALLAEADLVVVNGLGLEGWLNRLVAASGYEGPVAVASRDVDPVLTASGAPDPHAWHSLAQVRRYAETIAGELSRISPAHAPEFARRRDIFVGGLALVGRAVEGAIATIPPERRVAFTTHNAFAYLERDHGITVLAPAGPEGAAEGSARALAGLVARISETGAKAVFPEAGAEDRLAHVLADEAGVSVGGALYAGTLSGPDGPAPGFVEMWARNVFLMIGAMTP